MRTQQFDRVAYKKFKQKIEAVGFVERWNVEAWKFDKNID